MENTHISRKSENIATQQKFEYHWHFPLSINNELSIIYIGNVFSGIFFGLYCITSIYYSTHDCKLYVYSENVILECYKYECVFFFFTRVCSFVHRYYVGCVDGIIFWIVEVMAVELRNLYPYIRHVIFWSLAVCFELLFLG